VLELMSRISWTPNVYNEELFRVFEYGAMLVGLILGGKSADDQGSVRLDTMSRGRKVDVD
jgi:hypothetical protein